VKYSSGEHLYITVGAVLLNARDGGEDDDLEGIRVRANLDEAVAARS
jgi:hypothetical protein